MEAAIQFQTLDGFSAALSKERLLNDSPKASQAFIAVEDPKHPWPVLKKGKASAGPFYLIWKNPKLSGIGPEEWPYMLKGFEIKGDLKNLYPKIFPEGSLPEASPVQKGFHVFLKNCFVCHTLNKNGSSAMGPDLNVPMNPTEYLKEAALRKLIRNPQALRHWPQSKMSAFGPEVLSAKDLDHLIAYLKHMAPRKNP
jgi:mono/diheme cytochrome c family protein